MNITDIRIRRTYQDEMLRAIVSITLENTFVVHDIKIIKGPERLFVAMPSRKDENGVYRDIAHPICPDMRQDIESKILLAYQEHLKNAHAAESSATVAPV